MDVVADGKDYEYSFGSSLFTPDQPDFDYFSIEFVDLSPIYDCTEASQDKYQVTLKVTK